jgi:HK97 family phage portal protein
MVMHSDKASTYASAEAFFAAHLRHTLAPWLERLEQVYDRDLLDGTGPLEAKHDTRQLEKANAADRQRFYASMAQIGIYTRNEIRELEGLPPLAGLDEPLTPLNLRDGREGVEQP